MKRRGPLLLVVVVVGAILTFIGWKAWAMYRATETGRPALDKWRTAVIAAVARIFGASSSPAIARACMAIMNNEAPARWDGEALIVGDATLGGGPSVGPMQVYRATAKELGLWAPPPDVTTIEEEREAYALVSTDTARCIVMGVTVLKKKLEIANGDLEDAIRRYNGGGTKAAAYRDRALAFASEKWGDGWQATA